MKEKYDALVVGAGPAGLACSAELAARGLEVALLDEQAGPGGQIYRNITKASAKQHAILGEDYSAGLDLIKIFKENAVDYFPRTRVWQAEPNGDIYFSRNGGSRKVSADYLVLNTGAMERPVPFPGWTLPGVMTCGGMSNLFKDSSLSPTEPVVLAGSGPLLWLVAEHLFALEAPVAAILDTTPMGQMFSALNHMPKALKRFGFLLKGVKMIADVQVTAMKRKVAIHRGVTGLKAEGDDRLARVQARRGRKELNFEATTLLVSEGIIPNTSLLRQVGCAHTWDPVQRYWHPQVGIDGRTSLPAVFVAGDGNFVHGAKAAEFKGRLTALTIASEMRRISKKEYSEHSAQVREQLDRELFPRPFIDAMYAPRKDLYTLTDETIVCRCEGITAGQIQALVEDGYVDHNEIKAMIRCGMGPCQGRMCSSAVFEIIAAQSDIAPQELRQHRLRPPIKPVSLGELAEARIGGPDES